MSFAIAGTVLTVGATAYGAHQAGSAARTQANAANSATAETARQYDQTRADLSSGRSLYEGANSLLGQLYGIPIQSGNDFTNEQDQLVGDTLLPHGTTTKSVGNGYFEVSYNGQRIGTLRPGGANGQFINDTGTDIEALKTQQRSAASAGRQPGAPSLDPFFASPDYNFRRTEGTRNIENSFAARGGARSGNALRALTDFNSNLAAGEYGDYVNRLLNMAGLGANATNATATFGANAANNASRNALLAGDARASGITDRANIIGQGVNSLAGGLGYFFGNRKRPVGGTMSDYGGTGINPYTGRPI